MKWIKLWITLCIYILCMSLANALPFKMEKIGTTFSGNHEKSNPSSLELEQDLQQVSQYFNYIRTYSPTYGSLDMLKLLSKYPSLNILIGINVDKSFQKNLQIIIEDLQSNPKLKQQVVGILVGNETENLPDGARSTINTAIDLLHNKLPGVLIGSAQVASYWKADLVLSTGISNKVDFFAANLYPNICRSNPGPDKQPLVSCSSTVLMDPVKGLVQVKNQYANLKIELNRRFPTKELIVTETGWPTSYGVYGTADTAAGIKNQQKYTDEIYKWVLADEVKLFIYSFYDSQAANPASLFSFHRGLVNSKRNLKIDLPPLASNVCNTPEGINVSVSKDKTKAVFTWMKPQSFLDSPIQYFQINDAQNKFLWKGDNDGIKKFVADNLSGKSGEYIYKFYTVCKYGKSNARNYTLTIN